MSSNFKLQIFQDNNAPSLAFVITFGSKGDYVPYLGGEHEFDLTKTSTGEKLSFFKSIGQNRFYRLWCRRVINKTTDYVNEYQYKRAYGGCIY